MFVILGLATFTHQIPPAVAANQLPAAMGAVLHVAMGNVKLSPLCRAVMALRSGCPMPLRYVVGIVDIGRRFAAPRDSLEDFAANPHMLYGLGDLNLPVPVRFPFLSGHLVTLTHSLPPILLCGL